MGGTEREWGENCNNRAPMKPLAKTVQRVERKDGGNEGQRKGQWVSMDAASYP